MATTRKKKAESTRGREKWWLFRYQFLDRDDSEAPQTAMFEPPPPAKLDRESLLCAILTLLHPAVEVEAKNKMWTLAELTVNTAEHFAAFMLCNKAVVPNYGTVAKGHFQQFQGGAFRSLCVALTGPTEQWFCVRHEGRVARSHGAYQETLMAVLRRGLADTKQNIHYTPRIGVRTAQFAHVYRVVFSQAGQEGRKG